MSFSLLKYHDGKKDDTDNNDNGDDNDNGKVNDTTCSPAQSAPQGVSARCRQHWKWEDQFCIHISLLSADFIDDDG